MRRGITIKWCFSSPQELVGLAKFPAQALPTGCIHSDWSKFNQKLITAFGSLCWHQQSSRDFWEVWYGGFAYLYNYSVTVLFVCQELHEQGHTTTTGLATYLVRRWTGTFLSVLAITNHCQNNFRGVFFSWKHLKALCYEHLWRDGGGFSSLAWHTEQCYLFLLSRWMSSNSASSGTAGVYEHHGFWEQSLQSHSFVSTVHRR